MSGCKINPDFLNSLYDEINAINFEILNLLNAKEENEEFICTEEFVKYHFSKNIIEDTEFLNTLSGNPLFKVRHANMIIRDMIEQVIEFIYVMKNKAMIPDYLGINAPSNKLSSQNPIKGFRKLAGGRFSDGRKTVSEMAIDIGEKKSLYELYQLFSDKCHNSYYFSVLESVGEVETGIEQVALTEEQVNILTIVIDRFMETFRN